MIQPLFLVTATAVEIIAIATPILTTMGGAIALVYRRQIVLEDRQQANIERVAASGFATAEAINKMTSVIESLVRHAKTS